MQVTLDKCILSSVLGKCSGQRFSR